jgi:hypothetical protein
MALVARSVPSPQVVRHRCAACGGLVNCERFGSGLPLCATVIVRNKVDRATEPGELSGDVSELEDVWPLSPS